MATLSLLSRSVDRDAGLSYHRMVLTGCRSIPPSLSGANISYHNRRMSFPIDRDIVRRLRSSVPDLHIDPRLGARLQKDEEAGSRLREISQMDDCPGNPGLWPFQHVGSRWLQTIGRGILADEQAMGKTVQALDASRGFLWEKGLVVCSDTKKLDWVDHIQDWTSRQATRMDSSITDWKDFLICNYTQMLSDPHLLSQADLIILDECHKLRNRKTHMAKSARQICGRDKPIFMLTATPMVNTYEDIWILLNLCDPNRFSSFWSFAYRFLSVNSNGFGMMIGDVRPEEKENLDDLLSDYILRRPRSLLSDPEIHRRLIPYELLPQQRTLYHQMSTEGECCLGGTRIRSEGPLSLITRLRQIALHPMLLFPTYQGPSKLDELVKILRERDSKAVVFTMFEQMVEVALEY